MNYKDKILALLGTPELKDFLVRTYFRDSDFYDENVRPFLNSRNDLVWSKDLILTDIIEYEEVLMLYPKRQHVNLHLSLNQRLENLCRFGPSQVSALTLNDGVDVDLSTWRESTDWSALREVSIHRGQVCEDFQIEHIEKFISSKAMASVESFTYCHEGFRADTLFALASSPYLKSIRKLTLSGSEVLSEFGESFVSNCDMFEHMTHLTLTGWSMYQPFTDMLRVIPPTITHLKLHWCMLNARTLEKLGSMFPNLVSLDLSENFLQSSEIHALLNWNFISSLEHLDLSNTLMANSGAEILLHSEVLTSLETLTVKSNPLEKDYVLRLSDRWKLNK